MNYNRVTRISPTVEPLNKGHFGDNIKTDDMFFVERLCAFGDSKCIRPSGENTLGVLPFVERLIYYYVLIWESQLSEVPVPDRGA